MTEDEIGTLLQEFFQSRGGVVTDQQLDEMAETLKQHFPNPEQTSLNQARMVLGLPLPESPKGGKTCP